MVSLAVLLVLYPFIRLSYGNEIFFSHDSGYYESAFYLSILGGGNQEIHYTLDGSEPTINDPVFHKEAPLYIDDATDHANVYSARTDTSTGFLVDLIEEYSQDIPYYTVPDYNVDKCTVLRASLFDSYGNCLDSITGIYFIGFDEKKAYQNIYTASIVTSPENLFDEDIGIYVTGSTFKQFLENSLSKGEARFEAFWWWWAANYSYHGSDWEREACITIFDNHHNIVLSENCGIRIKGGGSRGKLPKSISCYARYNYNNSDSFQIDLFETGIFPDKIVFFSGGDDNIFKLQDYLANVMEQELHFATMDFIPCAMFLDGEYWGMYYITEDYNAKYIHDHYQVADGNIIMVKDNSISEGNDEDLKEFEEMRNFIIGHDMTDAGNYNQACTLIDIDSCVDYYAAQIYIGRSGDWPIGNYALWRTRKYESSFYGDCKWRWMLFDVNTSGFNIEQLPVDTLSYVLLSDPVFLSLYQNEEFRLKFAKRILYIGSEIFSSQKCEMFLDNYVQILKEPILNSNRRFYMDSKSDEFDKYVTDITTFLENRYDVVWNFLVDNMGKEWLLENGVQK